jgi:hypothetical protein
MSIENTHATRHSPLGTGPLPWYRHKLVWFVISIPLASVFAGIGMIYLAISSNDGLVVDDYYKEGIAINQSLERDERARELGLGAHLTIGETGDLVTMQFDKGRLDAYPEKLELGLYYSTRDGFDQTLQLLRGMDGSYIGYLDDRLRDGVWNVIVNGDNWRLVTRTSLNHGVDTDLAPVH